MNDREQIVEEWLNSIPDDTHDQVKQLRVRVASFGAGPSCLAGKYQTFEEPVNLADGLRWIAQYAGVLKAANLHFEDDSVLWFERHRCTRYDRDKRSPRTPGVVVHHPADKDDGDKGSKR